MFFWQDQNSRTQVQRFLVIGGLSFLIDFLVYRILLWILTWVSFSKASGFIVASVFAYLSNKKWTFKSERKGIKTIILFIIVYLINLILNTGANSLLLQFLDFSEASVWIAFLFASGLSASLNFLGMKFIVFKNENYKKI